MGGFGHGCVEVRARRVTRRWGWIVWVLAASCSPPSARPPLQASSELEDGEDRRIARGEDGTSAGRQHDVAAAEPKSSAADTTPPATWRPSGHVGQPGLAQQGSAAEAADRGRPAGAHQKAAHGPARPRRNAYINESMSPLLRRSGGQGSLGPLQVPHAVRAPAQRDTEAYAPRSDNPFHVVRDQPLSTFSIDVDTAAYANVRRFLNGSQRPPADAVRIEELVNYFSYDYRPPTGEDPFSIYAEVATTPWRPEHRLVHIGLKGREIASEGVPARNLVFLLDVSGSMQSSDKLPLLKAGMALLARQLRPQDSVAIVVYAGSSGVALPATFGSEQARVLGAIDALQAGGSTNGAAGIQLAYGIARERFIEGGINRVILATDGDFNVGVTSQGELTRLIEEKRKSGVFLTVLGFGQGNLKDSTMELLADKGNGNYAYIDSIREAEKVLVREAGSTLVTIAKDVKLQIEWNPKRVRSYRLIGYENRVLEDRDFNDDKKDAGEIGAGHTVTALYEVVLSDDGETAGEVDSLKYQAERPLRAAADSPELFTVKIRYKQPSGSKSKLLRHAVVDSGQDLEESSLDFRWAAAVAGFGMVLRDSEHRGAASLATVEQLARGAIGRDDHGDRHELLRLIAAARGLGM